MRLKDLVYRSAVRRGAGETELAAPPQVFEVTNLFVPAGTNWLNAMHVIGSVPVGEWNCVTYGVGWTLAVNDALGDLVIGIAYDPANPGTSPVDSWTASSGSGWNAGAVIDVARNMTGVEGDLTFYVGFWTPNGATSQDITVVSARAAFMVI